MIRKLSTVLKVVFSTLLLLALLGCTGCGDISGQSQLSESGYIHESRDVIKSGDDYHIIVRKVEDDSGVYDMVGVIDDNNEWIHELSKTHIFIGENSRIPPYEFGYAGFIILYHGENMFSLSYRTEEMNNIYEAYTLLYDAENNFGFDAGICEGLADFHDGYSFALYEEKVKIIGCDGTIIQTDITCDIWELGRYSEGLFFAEDSFYDITGAKVIDMSELLAEYPGHFFEYKVPYFDGGECVFEIQTSVHTAYRIHIDKNGEVLGAPLEMTIIPVPK